MESSASGSTCERWKNTACITMLMCLPRPALVATFWASTTKRRAFLSARPGGLGYRSWELIGVGFNCMMISLIKIGCTDVNVNHVLTSLKILRKGLLKLLQVPLWRIQEESSVFL